MWCDADGKYNFDTSGVILVCFEYSPVKKLEVLFLICSNLSMFSLVDGSHTADAYSSTSLTKVRQHFSFIFLLHLEKFFLIRPKVLFDFLIKALTWELPDSFY